MRVFVDTSVWIEFFRGRPAAVKGLSELLDADRVALAAPVRIELLSGVRRGDRQKLRRVLSAIPVYRPGDRTWQCMEEWVEKGSLAGQRFGVVDILIAAIAVENGGVLWSFDEDFRRMAALGWIGLHEAVA